MTVRIDRRINKIYITAEVERDELTDRIRNAYPDARKIVVASDRSLDAIAKSDDPKRILLLTHSKGQIVKDCPGTAAPYLCCRYQVINQTLNCPLNCTYCILQFYLNQPATIIYTDYENIITETDRLIKSQPRRFFRFGTGELGDSLALSASQFFAIKMIDYFASRPNALLELKTKTDRIDSVLERVHNGHTVISWSLNPPVITRVEEHLAAPVSARLKAAGEAARRGFLIGFHFDPILDIPDWEKHYGALIDELYENIDPARIAWISMGSLRFPPAMKEKIIARYPRSKIPYGEMIRGLDQKMRYFRLRRIGLYQAIYRKLTGVANPPFIYFCMESAAVWRSVCNFSPESNAHLDYLFAESLWRRFPGLIAIQPERIDYENVPKSIEFRTESTTV